jgi:hypothetical protein
MRPRLVVLLLLALTGAIPAASAKTIRYASGPKAPADTALSSAEFEIDPIVRARGPRVPATNLQLASLVANRAFDRALAAAPLDSGSHVVIAPAESHPLNYVAEHAVLRHLGTRGVSATVMRSVIPDDSLGSVGGGHGDPVLEYQLGTARVTYLRLVGWLPGRVRIERQGLVEGALTLRDPRTARVLWLADARDNLVDAFPRSQLALVEDARFEELKGQAPTRNVDKVFEPVLAVAVVAGLVALFFQNRP